MPTLFVFEFETYDRDRRMWKRDGRRALPSTINALGAIMVVGSGVEVDAARVDAAGYFTDLPGGRSREPAA